MPIARQHHGAVDCKSLRLLCLLVFLKPHLLLLLLHLLQDWLSRNNRSPMTNEALGSKRLLPNHALRSAIMEARQAAAASSR
jgi:hypothetical protein